MREPLGGVYFCMLNLTGAEPFRHSARVSIPHESLNAQLFRCIRGCRRLRADRRFCATHPPALFAACMDLNDRLPATRPDCLGVT